MPITFEDIVQTVLNLIAERDKLKMENDALRKKVADLQVRLEAMNEPSRPKNKADT